MTLSGRIGAYLEGDKVIWMVTLILSLGSLLAVYSAISSLAYKSEGGSLHFLFKQGLMLALGWGVMLLIHKVNFRYFSRISQVLIWVAALLLILTLVFGADINEAKRWLRIPFTRLTLQTSDFAKVVLVTYVARELNNRRTQLHDFRTGVLPILVPIGLICLLILPADFSTAALLGVVCIGMLFIGGVPWKHLFKIGGLGVVALVMLYGIGKAAPEVLPRFGTWAGRIERFVGVGTAAEGDALEYQIELAQVAINRGGLLPHGPGTGTSRNFLPHPYSDMIYAFIIEEWGAILGGLGLVLAYLILLFRTVRTATRCPPPFWRIIGHGARLHARVSSDDQHGRCCALVSDHRPATSFGILWRHFHDFYMPRHWHDPGRFKICHRSRKMGTIQQQRQASKQSIRSQLLFQCLNLLSASNGLLFPAVVRAATSIRHWLLQTKSNGETPSATSYLSGPSVAWKWKKFPPQATPYTACGLQG